MRPTVSLGSLVRSACIVAALATSLGSVGCGGGGGGGNPAGAPTATIVFPPPSSLTDADTILVRGTASDTDGVASVTVNGVTATSGDGFATWEAVIPVPVGDTPIVVNAMDGIGTAGTDLAPVTAVTRRGPSSYGPLDLAYDASIHTIYMVDQAVDGLTAIDVNTMLSTVVSGPGVGLGPTIANPSSLAIDTVHEIAYVIDQDAPARLMAISLVTHTRELISGPGLGAGPALDSATYGVALDVASNFAYVSQPASQALLRINLTNGDRTIVSSSVVGSGPSIGSPADVALDLGNGRAFVSTRVAADGMVLSIDLATGNRAIVSGGGVGSGPALTPYDLVYDAASATLYANDYLFNAIATMDTATGNRTLLSANAVPWTGPFIEQPSGLVLDLPSGRLWYGEGSPDGIIELSVPSGNRQFVYPLHRGAGPSIEGLDGLALESAHPTAWVVDYLTDRVLAVDRVTGDRTPVVGSGPVLGNNPADVVIDEAAGRLLVLRDSAADALFAVDLVSGARTILSGAGVGNGPDMASPTGLALDDAEGRVLVADTALHSVFSIDLVTGDRAILSGPGVGAGPALNFVGGVSLDPVHSRALVLDSAASGVVAIDLLTGDRTVFSNAGHGAGPSINAFVDGSVDVDGNRMLVFGAGSSSLVAVDLETGNRTIVSGPGVGAGPLFSSNRADVQVDPDTGLLWVADQGRNAILAVDPLTGERVIVSR